MRNYIKQYILVLLTALLALPASAANVGDRFTYDGVTYQIVQMREKNPDGTWKAGTRMEVEIVTTSRTGDVVFESEVTDSVNTTFHVVGTYPRTLRNLPGITSITFSEGFLYISHESMRYNENLVSVHLPSTVIHVDSHVCRDCPNFTGFTVDANNPYFYAENGVLFQRNRDEGLTLVSYPNASNATTYSIPDGVNHIDQYAFDSSAKLRKLTLPASLTTIDDEAYFICEMDGFEVAAGNTAFATNTANVSSDSILYNKLKTKIMAVPVNKSGSYNVPSSVTEIKAAAFKSSKLTTVNLSGSGITKLEIDVFRGMLNLTTVSLPASINDIPGTFTRESACQAINVDGNNPTYMSNGGVVFTKDGTKLVSYPPRKNQNSSYSVPSNTIEIGDGAFFESELSSVSFPATLTKIGTSAFQWNFSLTSVSDASGSNLQEIGESAFWACHNLTTANLGNSPIEIVDENAFQNCIRLTSAMIANEHLLYIRECAFENCPLLTNVGDLSESSLIEIGARAFNNVPLAVVNFPATLTKIGPSAFSKDEDFAALKSVTFAGKDNLTEIGDNAFQNNKQMAPIDLSEFTHLTTIGNQAFNGCEQYREVTIPSCVTSLGHQAFVFCRNMTAIHVDAANPNYRDIDGMLLSKDGKVLLSYPGGKMSTEFDFQKSKKGTSNYVMIPPVDEIADSVFYSVYTVRDIKIPGTVKKIGESAFYRTLNLRYLSMLGDELPTDYDECLIKLRDEDRAGNQLGDVNEAKLFVRSSLADAYTAAWKKANAFDKIYTSFTVEATGMEFFPWSENRNSRMVAPGYDPDIIVDDNSGLASEDEDMSAGAKGFVMEREPAAEQEVEIGFTDENGWHFEKVALVDVNASQKTLIVADSIPGNFGIQNGVYSVRVVMDNAFENATNLTDATFFGDLEYIAPNAFATGKSNMALYFVNLESSENSKPLASAEGNYGTVYGTEFANGQTLYVKKSVYDMMEDDNCPQIVAANPTKAQWQIKKLNLSAVNGQPYTAATLCREFDIDMSGCEAVTPYRIKDADHWEKDAADPGTVTGYLNAWSVPDRQIHAGEGVLLRANEGTANNGLFYAIRETQGFTLSAEDVSDDPEYDMDFYNQNALIGVYTAQTLTSVGTEMADNYTPVSIQPNGYPKTAEEVTAQTPATPTFIMGWSSTKGMFVKMKYDPADPTHNVLAAFRAFYKAPDETANFANVNIVMSFSESDAPTGINEMTTDSDDAPYYGIDGIRYDRPVRKGVYIRNGKKVTIK